LEATGRSCAHDVVGHGRCRRRQSKTTFGQNKKKFLTQSFTMTWSQVPMVRIPSRGLRRTGHGHYRRQQKLQSLPPFIVPPGCQRTSSTLSSSVKDSSSESIPFIGHEVDDGLYTPRTGGQGEVCWRQQEDLAPTALSAMVVVEDGKAE